MIVELFVGYLIGRSSCKSRCQPRNAAVDRRQLSLPFEQPKPAIAGRGCGDKFGVLALFLVNLAMACWAMRLLDIVNGIGIR